MIEHLDGVEIEDMGITYVKIPYSSTAYLIDGELVEIDSYGMRRVQCKNPNDIRVVTKNKYIVEYRSGNETMTTEEYENRKYELRKCAEYDDGDYIRWNTLDDEFAYRKFIETWKPIYKTEQIISDPIKVSIEKTVYDTGSPYVKNAFMNGLDASDTMFSYDQNRAWKDFVKECFDDLDMAYSDNISYAKTANEKIWSNSSHGCIRYVVAFGTYVFGDGWDKPRFLMGTLSDMLERCKNDREVIRNIIIRQYNKHFGSIDAGTFDFEKLLNRLEIVRKKLDDIKVYAKSGETYWSVKNTLKDAINQIHAAYGGIDTQDGQ